MLNRKTLAASLLVAFGAAGLTAHAQDRDHGRQDRYERDGRAMEQRGYDRDGHWAEHRDRDRDRDARTMGGPEEHRWHRGDRVPDEYRHGGYVDWREHHLHAPPRGYQWVDVDGNYALIAVGTGVIADLILNSR